MADPSQCPNGSDAAGPGTTGSETAIQGAVGPGRPKDPAKREAILQAAKCLFMRHGYAGCSMEAVSAEAGVSKLTVYSHFQDKDTLFAAAVRSKCEEQLPDPLFELPEDMPIEEALQAIGEAFFALVNNPDTLEFHRLMVASAHQDPHLSRLFYEAGPQRVQAGMERFLAAACRQGKLSLPSTRVTADQFLCLLKGNLHFYLLTGCRGMPEPDEVQAQVRQAVELILRAHAPAKRRKALDTQG